MEIQDLNGVFINHLNIRKNEKTNKEFATFSIAYSEKNGKDKFKTSFVDGIAAFPNIIKKLRYADEKDRFVFKGKLKSNQYKDKDGKNTKQIVVEVHTLTKVENPFNTENDPYSDPNSRLLQEDPYMPKQYATMPGDVPEEDLPF